MFNKNFFGERVLTYFQKKPFTTNSSANPSLTSYSRGLSFLHWVQAAGFTGCTISGFIASRINPKTAPKEKIEQKKILMHLHKSFGLLMFGAILPRIWFRVSSQIPTHLPGKKLELLSAKISHMLLNFMMVAMPLTGVGMGYYSGWGVPFFKFHLPGIDKKKSQMEKYKSRTGLMYKIHKFLGQALEYLLPFHIGAAFLGLFKGQNLFVRMNPFRK
jgi:cytochrome b561